MIPRTDPAKRRAKHNSDVAEGAMRMARNLGITFNDGNADAAELPPVDNKNT